jgi:hypothetical protein
MSLNCGHQHAYCSSSIWYLSMEKHGGMILTGEEREIREKTCPRATLSTINPTWTEPGTNSSLRGERPATSRLGHSTAYNYGRYLPSDVMVGLLCVVTGNRLVSKQLCPVSWSGSHLEMTEHSNEPLSQDSRCTFRDLNWVPPKSYVKPLALIQLCQ